MKESPCTIESDDSWTGGFVIEKRDAGIDLLRLMAFLFVVVFHSFLYNGYYYVSQIGATMLLAGSIRWLSVSCNGLFLMISGYLLSVKFNIRSCWERLFPVLTVYLLAAAISVPIRHFFLQDAQSVFSWMGELVGFGAVGYGWYVEMYVGLVMLIPFVNRMIYQLSEGMLLVFCGVLLMLTALPGTTPLNLAPDWWRGMYPLTYYALGATVRRIQPKIPIWLGLSLAALIALGMGMATLFSTDGILAEALTWEFADLWIVMITVCLFLSLYRISVNKPMAALLHFAAKGCYGGYLLSALLDVCCYTQVDDWKAPDSYFLIFAAITLPIYLICLLGGRMLQWITDCIIFRKGG